MIAFRGWGTHLLGIDSERALALAIRTVADLDFLGRILVKRAKDGPAFATVELDIFQLREYACPSRNNPRYTNKGIEMRSAEVPQR